MAKIDQFIVPGDLDLDRVTLTIVPGSHFFLGAYTYQVSSRWENGKGVKIPGRTPYAGMEHLYICVAADKNYSNYDFFQTPTPTMILGDPWGLLQKWNSPQ